MDLLPPQAFDIAIIDYYLERTRQIESGGNDNAVSSTGAAGPFQFTKGTATAFDLTLDDRFDLAKSRNAAARLAVCNAAQLHYILGRAPTVGEVYLAHQQGALGAASLLAYPNLPGAEAMVAGGAFKDIEKARRAIAVNGGDPDLPAAHFSNRWVSKFEDPRKPMGSVDTFLSPVFKKQVVKLAPVRLYGPSILERIVDMIVAIYDPFKVITSAVAHVFGNKGAK